jgi:rSAM/selenodomain-associated transferase 1
MNPKTTVSRRALGIFAKAPEPGNVKTRLAADIGEERAVALYRAFLEDLARLGTDVSKRFTEEFQLLLGYAGDATSPGFDAFRRRGYEFIEQAGRDLGERMKRYFRGQLAERDAVVLIGADSPTLGPGVIAEAFSKLETGGVDVVFGPSFDGGYYLIGMTRQCSELFEGIDWSTPNVLSQSLRAASRAGIQTELLEFWYDVDEIEDLEFTKQHLETYLQSEYPERATATRSLLAEMTLADEEQD